MLQTCSFSTLLRARRLKLLQKMVANPDKHQLYLACLCARCLVEDSVSEAEGDLIAKSSTDKKGAQKIFTTQVYRENHIGDCFTAENSRNETKRDDADVAADSSPSFYQHVPKAQAMQAAGGDTNATSFSSSSYR